MSFVPMQRSRIFIALLLLISMISGVLASPAKAAEVVTALEIENGDEVHLYVDHNTAQLKALATLEGVSTKKDVTATAVWATTSATVVKVDKGKLTPVGAGAAKVTAKYEGKTVTVNVKVDFLYEAVRLNVDGTVAVELQDLPLGLTASAVESDGALFDVTTAAVWSSSDPAVATVDDGKVQLLKKGTTTITAKYKGRSDSVTYTVTSPYKALDLEYDGEYEFTVGQAPVQLDAIATLLNDLSETVNDKAVWSSSNSAVVSVEDGKLTFKSAGVADIQATRFGLTAKASVVVRLPYQALMLTPAKPVHMFLSDAPVQVEAHVANDFANKLEVTGEAEWTTSNPLVVSVDDGLLKPRGAGAAEVVVTYKGLQKKIEVTVMPVVNGLHLDETEMTLFKGEVAALPDVYGKDLNGTEYSFADIAEWTSSDEAVVVVENGKLKAKKPGAATVAMTIRGETDALEVTVREKALALLPQTSAYSLVRGETTALPKVTALLEDGTELEISGAVEWTTSSPNLLIAGTTMKALLNSKVTLTGSYLNKKITIPVTIEDKMTNVVVEPTAVTLNPKRSQTIKVTGKDSTGKTVTLTRSIVWTSSNPSAATVSGSTVRGVAEGAATLTATYQGQSLAVSVAVEPRLEKVVLSEKSAKLAVGGSTTFALTAYYDNGATKDVTHLATWTSSNVSVASVALGKTKGLKKGSVSVKAKFENKTATARVTVS
ncbi:Ig-like domain-containing protein [Paenibacillus sp.]|uniref:Ig-like domain-containing protein n=1 Tax=Paenibacillus sp. TaxID=58172 RepID=UPI0028119E9A|nr:Ig-like domain-containing protein [Paenibacillus sp.]